MCSDLCHGDRGFIGRSDNSHSMTTRGHTHGSTSRHRAPCRCRRRSVFSPRMRALSPIWSVFHNIKLLRRHTVIHNSVTQSLNCSGQFSGAAHGFRSKCDECDNVREYMHRYRRGKSPCARLSCLVPRCCTNNLTLRVHIAYHTGLLHKLKWRGSQIREENC